MLLIYVTGVDDNRGRRAQREMLLIHEIIEEGKQEEMILMQESIEYGGHRVNMLLMFLIISL